MTTTTDEVVAALERFATLPDWLAAPMRPHALEKSLRRHVPEIADGTLELLACEMDRLRAKGAQWPARCHVRVVAGAEARDVVLAGLLYPPDVPLPASRSSVPFGRPGYDVVLPDLRLHLAPATADPGLPALRDLSDPAASARVVQRVLRAGRHPDATVTAATPCIAQYKPGSRCTILYDVTYGSGPAAPPRRVVAKTYHGDKGAVAHQAMTALWDTPLAAGDVVLLAEPLGYLPGERILLQAAVPEDRTLKELVREAFTGMEPAALDRLRTELRRTATALAALHRSGAVFRDTFTWTDEVSETREILGRLSLTIPGLRSAAEPVLTMLEALDRAVGADPVVSAHHTFRPAQVLLSSGTVAVIDFDGAAMAEPGLDVGRFRAVLREIGATAPWGDEPCEADRLAARLKLLDQLCDLFLVEYERHAPVTLERVLLWETLDLLTEVVHAWSKVRLTSVGPRLAVLRHQLRTAALAT
ncbi:hypothetical protein [Georgenia sp. SYP-B2076]|uniref:hypothetical protein n=1 Tax=Georgenia sp. SYP-B2076 TaxID=2495881 RepID=UPI000F8D6617|nr:hypothetical protein [Georgenia sp. SYP-B2076]